MFPKMSDSDVHKERWEFHWRIISQELDTVIAKPSSKFGQFVVVFVPFFEKRMTPLVHLLAEIRWLNYCDVVNAAKLWDTLRFKRLVIKPFSRIRYPKTAPVRLPSFSYLLSQYFSFFFILSLFVIFEFSIVYAFRRHGPWCSLYLICACATRGDVTPGPKPFFVQQLVFDWGFHPKV